MTWIQPTCPPHTPAGLSASPVVSTSHSSYLTFYNKPYVSVLLYLPSASFETYDGLPTFFYSQVQILKGTFSRTRKGHRCLGISVKNSPWLCGYPIYLSTNKITHLLESILENMHTSTHLAQLNSPSSLIILYTY